MDELADWSGAISGRREPVDCLYLLTPASEDFPEDEPFRGTASDGNEYFSKTRESCPFGTERTLVFEQVTSAAGRLIGAPVCETPLIEIPTLLDGDTLQSGLVLRPGIAHASLALDNAVEGRVKLEHRGRDDNGRRQVGVLALYDWCFGADSQWLYDLNSDRSTYSHDHGMYFPGPFGAGTTSDLVTEVATPHQLDVDGTGLDRLEVDTVADALDAVTAQQLVEILMRIPPSWPATDAYLATMGWFLYRRARAVAARLRQL